MTVKIKFFSATVKFAAYLNAKNNSARKVLAEPNKAAKAENFVLFPKELCLAHSRCSVNNCGMKLLERFVEIEDYSLSSQV